MEKNYASFGKEVFEYLIENFNYLDDTFVPLMEIGQEHGLCKEVPYDPEKHGYMRFVELGDPIWWWGDDEKEAKC